MTNQVRSTFRRADPTGFHMDTDPPRLRQQTRSRPRASDDDREPCASRPRSDQRSRPPDHLDLLESHAVFVMREVAAECERPVLLFSGGKDSAVLLHLADKAFRPGRVPLPGDARRHRAQLRRGPRVPRRARWPSSASSCSSPRSRTRSTTGRVPTPARRRSRNRLQTVTLLDAITEHGFDACIGGARRDEDKARAKERVLSFRDAFGQWDPKRQRPELWQLYQGRVQPGEHLRAFPLSDWTELDIWQYIRREHIELPSIYFAHQRAGRRARRHAARRGASGSLPARASGARGDRAVPHRRRRHLHRAPCARRPPPSTTIIAEVAASRVSERGATRADDRFSETSMEDRKREGYF